MTSASTSAAPVPLSHERVLPRLFFGLNALSAWTGVAISTVSSALALYTYPLTDPNLLGNNTSPIGRLIDSYSYFTMWSNLTVAIVMTILVIAPRRGRVFQVFRLDSVLMISITGIVYWLLLAGTSVNQGIDRVGNVFNHAITPVLTVLVWLLVGPRNWIRWWTVPAALVLPVVWAVYALSRGSYLNAYPYPFLNVAKWGWSSVLLTVFEILVFGVILGLVYWGIDYLLSRRARAEQQSPADQRSA